VSATSTERDIFVNIYDIWYVNYNNNVAKRRDDLSALSVRLCGASTGNCTAFKKFYEYDDPLLRDTSVFYDMIPGTYYVDIVDSWLNYYFKGQIRAFSDDF
jgi:hypothetical protein